MKEGSQKRVIYWGLWGLFGLFIIGVVTVIVLGYVFNWDWVGVGVNTQEDYIDAPLRSKTLWNWMELLLVPIILAIAGFWFTYVQKLTELEIAREEQKTGRKIARDRQYQNTLETYFDRMTALLLKENLLQSQEGDGVRTIARARTMAVLRNLDKKRKGRVIQFLYESNLIKKDNVIVSLRDADLKGAVLRKAALRGVDLRGVSLGKADLSEADLSEADLSNATMDETCLFLANLQKAILFRVNLFRANVKGADLRDADLRYAELERVRMDMAHYGKGRAAFISRTNLWGANLEGAQLDDANLCGAKLNEANFTDSHLLGTNLEDAIVTNEQLLKAQFLNGATMPDGRKYEEWIKDSENQA